MKKIIHLSDLHVGHANLSEKLRHIIDTIILLKQPAKKYVVLATGDIVDNANIESQYGEAKAHMDRLEAAGFTVLLAPGNHDYGSGILAKREYVKAFKKTFFGQASIKYPKLDIIENTAFIGLDSMAEEIHWYDALFANGELGQDQLNRLDSTLDQPDVHACKYRVVYLHHHPFDAWFAHELKDSEALGQVLRKHGNVDALLYGHNHAAKVRNGAWDIPRCYDAGTATGKSDGVIRHRVIDLSRDPRWDYDGDFL